MEHGATSQSVEQTNRINKQLEFIEIASEWIIALKINKNVVILSNNNNRNKILIELTNSYGVFGAAVTS